MIAIGSRVIGAFGIDNAFGSATIVEVVIVFHTAGQHTHNFVFVKRGEFVLPTKRILHIEVITHLVAIVLEVSLDFRGRVEIAGGEIGALQGDIVVEDEAIGLGHFG